MRRFLFGLWLTLAILAGAVASLEAPVRAGAGSAWPATGLSGGPGFAAVLRGTRTLDRCMAGHPARQQVSRLRDGQTAGGDGPTPGEPAAWFAARRLPSPVPGPAAPAPGCSRPRPKACAAGGLEPEQGGRTGPPVTPWGAGLA